MVQNGNVMQTYSVYVEVNIEYAPVYIGNIPIFVPTVKLVK